MKIRLFYSLSRLFYSVSDIFTKIGQFLSRLGYKLFSLGARLKVKQDYKIYLKVVKNRENSADVYGDEGDDFNGNEVDDGESN